MYYHSSSSHDILMLEMASFVSLWNLKRHLTAHQGSQFSCNVCGAKFNYQYSLSRHTSNRHRVNEISIKRSDPKLSGREDDTALSLFQKAVSIVFLLFLIFQIILVCSFVYRKINCLSTVNLTSLRLVHFLLSLQVYKKLKKFFLVF